MAKKSAVEKQKRRQAMVARHFEKRKTLRETVKNPHMSDEERESARIALNKMPRNTSPSRLKNRCLLTGRPKGYMRKFKLSRICFREMASMGLIPGVTKSSW